MDFSVEQTRFPSEVHKNIYWAARQLTPLERSLEKIEDAKFKTSCEAYHAFVLTMLSDMYEDPEAYSLPVLQLEMFLNGRKANGAKQKEPGKTKKLLSLTYNAVNGYMLFLFTIARLGVLKEGALYLSSEDMKAVSARTKTGVSPISADARINALARVGLAWDGEKFTAGQDIFTGMCALAGAAEKASDFGYFAFTVCEFRNIAGKYKPVFEDYINPLIGDRRHVARALHIMALKKGLKPQISTFWKVNYKYKGAQALCIGTEKGELDVRITATYGGDDPALINDKLFAQSADFQKYVLRHSWLCTACSTSHLGRFTTILGKKRRVCMGGGIGFRSANPTEDELPNLEELIDMRTKIVDELKEA